MNIIYKMMGEKYKHRIVFTLFSCITMYEDDITTTKSPREQFLLLADVKGKRDCPSD